MNRQLQMHSLWALLVLAILILALMGYTFLLLKESANIDGRVQAVDAGTFTGLSLMFREVLSTMKSIWEREDRSQLMDQVDEAHAETEVAKAETEAAHADTVVSKVETLVAEVKTEAAETKAEAAKIEVPVEVKIVNPPEDPANVKDSSDEEPRTGTRDDTAPRS